MNHIRMLCLTMIFTFAAPGWAEESKPTPETMLAIAKQVNPSLVRVEYTLRYDKGEPPHGGMDSMMFYAHAGMFPGDYDTIIAEERPLEAAGYLLESGQVMTRDLLLHPRFIEKIVVRRGGQAVDAKVAAYAVERRAMYLELAEPLTGAEPLAFDGEAEGKRFGVYYAEDEGVWETTVAPVEALPALTVPEEGKAYQTGLAMGLVVDRDGRAIGFPAERADLAGDWRGSPVAWAQIDAAAYEALRTEVQTRADRGLLRVALSFRSPSKDAGGRFSFMMDSDDEGETERSVGGVLFDARHVLVLTKLAPKVTARLERIFVHHPDGEPVEATFVGTLAEYGGFIAELATELPGPLTLSDQDVASLRNELLPSVLLRIQGEQRVAYHAHRRLDDFELGWKRRVYPAYGGDNGALMLFTRVGELLAFPIQRRPKVEMGGRWSYRYDSDELLLMPAAYLREVLADYSKHLDSSNVPVSEEEENRLAWMGVELQGLDQELARINNVSHLTNDGEIGAIVSYVYPDSPAAKAGVEPGMILLRLHVDDYPKPIDVNLGYGGYFGGFQFDWSMLDDIPAEMLENMPAPWPSAENTFTRSLTDIGFGKSYRAEFFHDGETFFKTFTVEQGPPHFDAAARYKSEALGLTVRDLTYEVRRHFQKPDDAPGVIISKIESGEKAAVAGIKPYEIITKVNDEPVTSADDFERLIQGVTELRFNVNRLTQDRLVRIRLDEPIAEE